jgi:hypothetical protein
MHKAMHLRWLRLKRQTRLTGPRAAQRRTAAWGTLPIFTDLTVDPAVVTAPARSALR